MKYKIIDFDHGAGGLTTGMESSVMNCEVVVAPWLNDENSLCYNVNHQNLFEVGECEEYDNHDIAVFSPYFGDAFSRSGKNNIKFEEIKKVISFLKKYQSKYAIIAMKPDVVSFLSDKALISHTADGWPVYDWIVYSLKDDFYVYQFVIDEAAYGVPQHKIVNFYLCINKSNELLSLKKVTPRHNIQNGYVTIRKAIGDIESSEYSDYSSAFINYCSNFHALNLTWHDFNFKMSENCSYVKEGSNARRTKELTQKTGYIRPRYNKISPTLYFDFYSVASSKPSIHPSVNRPFTIREGARLFGLPDTFVWRRTLSNKRVANMIYNSVSPLVGEVIGEMVMNVMP